MDNGWGCAMQILKSFQNLPQIPLEHFKPSDFILLDVSPQSPTRYLSDKDYFLVLFILPRTHKVDYIGVFESLE